MTTTSGKVCIDDLVTVEAEYDPDVRWNGWLCPRLDAWSCVKVLDALNAEHGEGENRIYGIDYTFDEDGALVLDERQWRDEDPENYKPEVLPPNEDGLYALGAYSWVWSADFMWEG